MSSNISSSTNTSVVVFEPYELIDLWLALSIGGAVFGCLGNLFFGFIIRVFSKFWKYPNYRILFGVIVADFITNIFCIPFEGVQTYMWLKYRHFVGDDKFCMFESGIFIQSLSVSNLGQTLVAVYKLIGVFSPIFYKQKMSSPRNVTIIYVSFVLVPVALFFYGGLIWMIWYDMDPIIGDCRERSITSDIDMLRNVLFQYLPIIMSLIIYFCILLRILTLSGNNEEKMKIIKRSRGSMAMCSSMVIYAICVSLYWFEYASDSYGKAIGSNIWKKYAMRLTFSINPLFYATLDSNLRKSTIQVIRMTFGSANNAVETTEKTSI